MEFEKIYTSYWPKIFRLCLGYVNDEAWAKDLAQETFIIVWQQLSTFRNEAAISTWIFRIASNLCLKQTEKSKRLHVSNITNYSIAEQPATDIEAQTIFYINALQPCLKKSASLYRWNWKM